MTQDGELINGGRKFDAYYHAKSVRVNASFALNVITLSLHHRITSASAVWILSLPRPIHAVEDIGDVRAGEDVV